MGGEESRAHTALANQIPSKMANLYGYTEIDNTLKTSKAAIPRSQSFVPNRVINTAFNGVWSCVEPTTCHNPDPRVGQFTASTETHCFVGFGSKDGSPYQDLWKLDLRTMKWSEIMLMGDIPGPRNGSRAVVYRGTHLILFGGFWNNEYFNDLYSIDIATGQSRKLETIGVIPEPRSGAIMGTLGSKVFLWGGYNGTWPNSLHILDVTNMVWKQKTTKIPGRTGVPFVRYGNTIMSYGGSHQPGVLIIDMEKETIEIRETTGASPPVENMGAGMACIGNYILYYGGKGDNNKTLVYALHVERMWWFVFHVLPDHETVTLDDGHITEHGLFMLPRMHSFSCVYSQARRQVICFFGAPVQKHCKFFVFAVGSAMSVINHREDMKNMLWFE